MGEEDMKYQAIIFDLDGVICSTDQYHYEAWKTIAKQLNIHFDEEINNRLRGVSRMDSLNIILENYEGQLTDLQKVQYAEEKNTIYRRLLENLSESDASNEVRVTLSVLREKGLKLAIGSSSKNAKWTGYT
jgi:beta-phosphoglucomutase